MIALKQINMTLDRSSIANALREVKLFESQLKPAMQCLIEYLTEKGVEIARAELIFFDEPAYDTGALSDSVEYEVMEDKAVISAGNGLTNAMGVPTNYAVFVEYGTGIYGADVNDHGAEGWWYPAPWGWWTPKTGKYSGQPMAHTFGMPARPFMYNTLRDLEDEVQANGGRIIAEYIRGERA